MDKTDTNNWRWGRGALALVLALLFLVLALPNTGRVVVDSWMKFVLAAVPLVCIILGMLRWSGVERIGWGMLVILVILAFLR